MNVLSLDRERSVKVPLRVDEGGAVRVGETRVSLLSVLAAFQRGATPEQVVHSFPTLRLQDVYAVISYYLANRAELDAWIAEERLEFERVRKETEARCGHEDIRERLLKRKAEQERPV
ncbi:MAG TPA: hypothetical protein DCM87_21080 [Planctomycetes bacterium]|nr:hypothetical protein [Planctomycetota bacterium]